MSIKSLSSGVIFSVALIHMLGESLTTLETGQKLLTPKHDEHEEEGHEDHRRLEEGHDEHAGEAGGHKHAFPLGMTLCVVGVLLTLGLHVLGGVVLQMSKKENEASGEEHKELKQIDAAEVKDVGDIEIGNVTAVAETSETDNAASCCADEKQTCNTSCNKDYGSASTNDDDDEIHRHVSIVKEDRQRSVIKSIILEGCVSLHSVLIGLSVGNMKDYTELGAFLVAISFHQLLEGISLGAASMQASHDKRTTFVFFFLFVLSLPLGIVIGISLPQTPYAKAVAACVSCIAAGSLIYTALVEMVAEDFAHISTAIKDRETAIKAGAMYLSFFAGCAFMAVLAQWA